MHWKVCEFILKVIVYQAKTYKKKRSVTLFGVSFFSAVEVSGSSDELWLVLKLGNVVSCVAYL